MYDIISIYACVRSVFLFLRGAAELCADGLRGGRRFGGRRGERLPGEVPQLAGAALQAPERHGGGGHGAGLVPRKGFGGFQWISVDVGGFWWLFLAFLMDFGGFSWVFPWFFRGFSWFFHGFSI